jgi:hypothetical protein
MIRSFDCERHPCAQKTFDLEFALWLNSCRTRTASPGDNPLNFKYFWMCVLFLAFVLPAYADGNNEVVDIAVTETTLVNEPPDFVYNTGVPLTFQSGNEILSIAINWEATGTPNFPFPIINGAEDAVTLNGALIDSVCNYLVQTGPNQFSAVDCTNLNSSPYQSSVTFSGNWGSAEIGYGGSVPITINSTFTSQTIMPEPGSLALLAVGLVGLISFRRLSQLRS